MQQIFFATASACFIALTILFGLRINTLSKRKRRRRYFEAERVCHELAEEMQDLSSRIAALEDKETEDYTDKTFLIGRIQQRIGSMRSTINWADSTGSPKTVSDDVLRRCVTDAIADLTKVVSMIGDDKPLFEKMKLHADIAEAESRPFAIDRAHLRKVCQTVMDLKEEAFKLVEGHTLPAHYLKVGDRLYMIMLHMAKECEMGLKNTD